MIEQVLTTADGVRISATLAVGVGPSVERGLCFVVVHGFTGNWRQERVSAIVERLRRLGIDGLIAALQILAVVQRQGRPVSEICHRFDPVPQILKNVRYDHGQPLED